MSNDDDIAYDPDVYTEGECDACGEVRQVFVSVDPFIRDVYPPGDDEEPLEESWWCDKCFDARADDI